MPAICASPNTTAGCRSDGRRHADKARLICVSAPSGRRVGPTPNPIDVTPQWWRGGAAPTPETQPPKTELSCRLPERTSTMTEISAAGTYRLGDRDVKRMGYGAMQLAGPGVFGPPRDRDAALAV